MLRRSKQVMDGTILLIGPLGRFSGNRITLERLQSHLKENWHCLLKDSTELNSNEELDNYINKNNVDAVIGIHAYKTGALLHECPIPYSIIFGGTDLSQYYSEKESLEVMSAAVNSARFLIAFGKKMHARAKEIWPKLPSELVLEIPQGICVYPSSIDIYTSFRSRGISLPNNATVFLIVAGLRPVKDVTFLVEEFSKWHLNSASHAFLVVIGPVIDEAYGKEAIETMHSTPGIAYAGTFSHADTHALMQQSFAVVNSSISEGMSAALVEAMALGIPVLAKRNYGNEELVVHSDTGLLYDTPKEFISQASMLLDDEQGRLELALAGQKYIRTHHDAAQEKAAYIDIVREMISKSHGHILNQE